MMTLKTLSSRGAMVDRGTLWPLLLTTIFFLARTAAKAETIVSLEFDDERASQWTARDILRAHNLKATFFVNSNRIGASGYLTMAQLHDLENDGHEIGGHTLDHLDLATLSAAEAQRQICDDRTALLAAGFRVLHFAYPFGSYNASVESIVAGCSYSSGRTIGGLGCAGCAPIETIPPADLYATATRESVKNTTTLAMLESWVTSAEAYGGGWVQIVMHDVCDSCGTYAVSSATLTAFLDWLSLRSANGTVVKTVREVLDNVPPETTVSCSPRGCSQWNNGPVTVTLTSVDSASGVAEIRYTIDGTDPGGPGGSVCGGNPCSFTVSATTTVKYQARDRAGNIEATKSQTISIDTQSPNVAITSPTNLSLVLGTITVKASASDNVGISGVSFFVDGRLIGTSNAAPYQVSWQSGRESIGTHQLTAEATDLAGNTARSATVDVIVGPSL